MKPRTFAVRVILAPDGFYPQALQGQDGTLRVLGVEEFRTTGMQRRFRVRTPEGVYDLGLDLSTGIWQIHRRPGWLRARPGALGCTAALPAAGGQASRSPEDEGGSAEPRLTL